MKTGLVADGPPGAAGRAVRRFLIDSERGQPADLLSYCDEVTPADSVTVVSALVKADLNRRFALGERPAVAEYLDRYPALRARHDRVVSLVYEEFCLREEHGARPDTEEFCARYSTWKDSIASQLRYHRVLSKIIGPPATPTQFPALGDYFEEFLLQAELGRGGAGRVFLAEDKSLHRLVALKVSPDRGNEPSILGRLSHQHIMPVHSVAFDPETDLRGLCMPYHAGLPLDDVIRRVGPGTRPAHAQALWDALTAPSDGPTAAAVDDGEKVMGVGWAAFPARGSYADAVAWLGLALAEALRHAHSRGIQHRDVKPANVLLTFKYGPQLLDFNLAHEPDSASQAEAAMRGGTLPYMAPEQLDAFLAPEKWGTVDARADLYSLGLVLRELLTGDPPETTDPSIPLVRAIRTLLARRPQTRTDLRAANPTITFALEAIVARCLAYEPDDRYPDAAALADDLKRCLDRRPLAVARNPSRRERLDNRLERNRRWVSAAALAALVVSAAVGTHILRPSGASAPVGPENDPGFTRALAAFESGRHAEALAGLEGVAARHSDSRLVNFYLSATLTALGREAAAVERLAPMLDSPHYQDGFIQWASMHTRFAGHAEELGRALLNGASGRTADSPEARLAAKAFGLAYVSENDRRRDRLAEANEAEIGGHLEASADLLTPLILGAGGLMDSPTTAPSWVCEAVFARARVRTQAARKILDAPDGPAPKADRLLHEAIADLAAARRLFRPSAPGTVSLMDVDFVGCEAQLALGHVLERLGKAADARASFDESRRLLRTVLDQATSPDQFSDLERRVAAVLPEKAPADH